MIEKKFLLFPSLSLLPPPSKLSPWSTDLELVHERCLRRKEFAYLRALAEGEWDKRSRKKGWNGGMFWTELLLLFSRSDMSNSLPPHGLKHGQASLSFTISGGCSNSLSWWYHPIISSSVIPFSSCLQSSQHHGLFQWVSSSYVFHLESSTFSDT